MLWRIIGAELGIDVDTLSSIERGQTTTRGCLHRMINEANPPITRNAMTRVLQSERITNAIAGMYIILILLESSIINYCMVCSLVKLIFIFYKKNSPYLDYSII